MNTKQVKQHPVPPFHQPKTVEQKQNPQMSLEQWRNVPGDIDDFIFCQQEFHKSEK